MVNRLGAARAAVGLVLSLAWVVALAGPGQQSFFDAYELQKAGRLQEAAAKYEAGLKAEPKNAMANFYLGQVYEQLGRDAQARQQFEKVTRLDPNGQYGSQAKARLAGTPAPAPAKAGGAALERKVNAAADAFQAGQYGEAAHLFREVVGQDPKHALAWHFLGQSLEKVGDIAGATRAYGRSLRAQSDGQVADRTRQMLSKLPPLDPVKIVLPTGVTLYDYMASLDGRIAKEDPLRLLAEVTDFATDYGPFPQLAVVQERLLAQTLSNAPVISSETAQRSLPVLSRLHELAPGNLEITRRLALAYHYQRNFAKARSLYSDWLQAARPEDSRRRRILGYLELANRGETLVNVPAAGKTFQDCPECPAMVELPPGVFSMGSDASDVEKPIHLVKITKPFSIGKTEVTQGQWRAIMGNNPSYFSNCGDLCPVENVSWHDAQNFLRKLSERTGKVYRLPTEAEWEYACRAGSESIYCGDDDPVPVAWYNDNSEKSIHSVGIRQPNAWGLHDMSGNVWEWVEDCYHDSYRDAPSDGTAWIGGECTYRSQRGGSWANGWPNVRSGKRVFDEPPNRHNNIGFRVVRALP